MQTEQHPEERIMQEEAELDRYYRWREEKAQEEYDEYMANLHKERNKKLENLLAQIRLAKSICEDAEDNIKSIRESL